MITRMEPDAGYDIAMRPGDPYAASPHAITIGVLELAGIDVPGMSELDYEEQQLASIEGRLASNPMDEELAEEAEVQRELVDEIRAEIIQAIIEAGEDADQPRVRDVGVRG